MGNTHVTKYKPTSTYENTYWTLTSDEINDLHQNYDIVNVNRPIDSLYLANLLRDNQELTPHKVDSVLSMADYFVSHTDSAIYTKKTNYLCNKKEKICICNTTATDHRRFADCINFTDDIFVAWIKKIDEPF